jgi:hypothetical protein
MAEQRSYTGEYIYVGVDVHKDMYTVTCVCQRQIVKTATVPADPARLAESLARWFRGATLSSAYEAGFSGFVLHRPLTGRDHQPCGQSGVCRGGRQRESQNGSPRRQETGNRFDGRALAWHRGPDGSRGTCPASPAHPRRLSNTVPPMPARSKPHCISLG